MSKTYSKSFNGGAELEFGSEALGIADLCARGAARTRKMNDARLGACSTCPTGM